MTVPPVQSPPSIDVPLSPLSPLSPISPISPHSSQSVTPGSVDSCTATTIARKRKRSEVTDPVEQFLLKEIKNNKQEEKDPDEMFCSSIVATLHRLEPKDNQMAKIKIQQLLFDFEFKD